MTVARLNAIDIAIHWRWPAVVGLATLLLAHSVLPVRYPTWETLTLWMTSGAAVLAAEAALLLHELSHALIARRHGHLVHRIVFHGFMAETQMVHAAPELLMALAGPAMNIGIALIAAVLRAVLVPAGPIDLLLSTVVVGNVAAATLSVLPLGESDGRRALTAWLARSSGSR
jgi:Zn-dependent protease